MNRLRFLIAAATTLGLTLLVQSAQAHPGHRLGEHGPLHLATSPYHLAILAGAGAILWFGARFIEKELPRRSMQTLGVLSVIAAAVLWGLLA